MLSNKGSSTASKSLPRPSYAHPCRSTILHRFHATCFEPRWLRYRQFLGINNFAGVLPHVERNNSGKWWCTNSWGRMHPGTNSPLAESPTERAQLQVWLPKSLELYHGTEPESITYPADTNPLILPLLSDCDRKALKCPHPTPENCLQTDTWIALKKIQLYHSRAYCHFILQLRVLC